MSTYIPVTPEWLTAALRQSGVLKLGEVSAVERKTTGAFNSHASHLLLHYSADAALFGFSCLFRTAMMGQARSIGGRKCSVWQRHFGSGIVNICLISRFSTHTFLKVMEHRRGNWLGTEVS